MEVNNYFLFPTVVGHTKHEVSDNEKVDLIDLYMMKSDEDGRSHDLLGFERLQKSTEFQAHIMPKLKLALQEYFKCLKIHPDKLEVQVTKAFFNVTDQASINIHDHAENHLSFTYYPIVAEGKERNLILHDIKDCHANEPYQGWFYHHLLEWTEINCRNYSFPVSEGVMFLFPSKMQHEIELKEGDIPHKGHQKVDGSETESVGFKHPRDLWRTRFCVAGDLLFTKKPDIQKYHRTLSHPTNWRPVL